MKQIVKWAVIAVLVAWAAGSVRASITPSYEDGGKTMVLDVGRKIRITGADTLDSRTFGKARTLVSTTAVMSPDLPTKLELVDSAGTAMQAPVWKLNLNPSGTALTFGAARGVVVIMR